MTPSKLSRIESSFVRPKPDDVRALANFYGAPPETVRRLTHEAENAQLPAWWTEYVGPGWSAALKEHLDLETNANRIDSWTIDLIPGLLQINEYITALIDGRPDVENDQLKQRLELRAARRERVERGELELWAVMSETVLHQEIGGRYVLADQLKYLRDSPSNVTIQVIPFIAGAHAGLGTSFHVMKFADWSPMIYQDTITKGLYRDDEETVEAHINAMDHIRAAALSPRESRKLLMAQINELDEQ